MENQTEKIVEIIKTQIGGKIALEESKKKERKRLYISDLHFDDERLNLYGRDILFKNAKEVNEYIIERWNSVVDSKDLVIVGGDISMTLDGLENLKNCNGEKWLVRGNYDININDESGLGTAKYDVNKKVLSKYFTKIVDELEIEIGGEKCYINHYPVNAKEEIFNIVGHTHGLNLVSRNSLNISADANHFTPLSEDRVLFLRNAIRKYYDQNCFPNELISSVKNRVGVIKILRAPEYDKLATFEESKDIIVFMAGPAQGCENWQEEFMEKIQKELKEIKTSKNIVLCSPRRLEKPKNFVYEEQVEWESFYLGKASKQGLIIFWFAKETEKIPGRSFARTSRFEIGEWFAKSQITPGIKMIIGRENGFEGFEYIENRLKSVDENFETTVNKKDMIAEIVKQIKKLI